MSKLKEYLKLIPDGLKNFDSLLTAIVNDKGLSKLSEDQKEEIIKRRAICKTCPFMSLNTDNQEFKDLNNGQQYKTSRKDEHCTFCGCPITTRTAALNMNCGVEKYNNSHPDSQLLLKWKKYDGGES